MLELDVVRASVPRSMRTHVTPEFITKLNNLSADPVESEILGESIVGYMNVLQSGKYKMDSYINAVKFVTYTSLGSGVLEAWGKVFPDRYSQCVANGATNKTLQSYASHYKSGKLVVDLFERMLTPTHILNAPYLQEAINKQVELMRHSKSERIQLDASSSLMTILKMPETAKMELDITVGADSELAELARLSSQLAQQQLLAMKDGRFNAQDVAHQRITIQGEVTEVDTDE